MSRPCALWASAAGPAQGLMNTLVGLVIPTHGHLYDGCAGCRHHVSMAWKRSRPARWRWNGAGRGRSGGGKRWGDVSAVLPFQLATDRCCQRSLRPLSRTGPALTPGPVSRLCAERQSIDGSEHAHMGLAFAGPNIHHPPASPPWSQVGLNFCASHSAAANTTLLQI